MKQILIVDSVNQISTVPMLLIIVTVMAAFVLSLLNILSIPANITIQ